MKLADLLLNRFLYKASQSSETKDSSLVSIDSTPAPVPGVASGGAAQDINTGNVFINGNQLEPGTIPQSVLDVSNWGWGQTCAFSSSSGTVVAWGVGVFKSADGTTYNISAGNTGTMAAKTYVYLDLNVSSTAYQVTTTPATAVGLGKVLIAVAQNASSGNATYNLSEATQIVGDNILANSINASKIVTGQLIVGTNVGLGTAQDSSGVTTIIGNTVDTGFVNALSITAGSVAAENITGTTISGKTVQTTSSGLRTVLDSADDQIKFMYNSTVYGFIEPYVFASGQGVLVSTGGEDAYMFVQEGTIASVGMVIVGGRGITVSQDTNVQINGATTVTGNISATNLSGTNTGDSSGHSGLSTLTGNNTFSGVNTFNDEATGNYFNWIRATGSAPQFGTVAARFLIYGNAVHYTSLVNDSDEKLKKNIETLTYGLREIEAISPIRYEYKKEDIPGLHLGFTAQDIEKVMPELVFEDDDDGVTIKTLASIELIPVLVKAIQELSEEVKKLKA